MRREPKPDFDSYKIFPVFNWPKCCVCNKTFGFEMGYEVSFPITNSVCKQCCGANQTNAEKILQTTKKNRKLKWPSPPGRQASQMPIQKRSNDNTETNNNYIIRKEIKCDDSYLP